MNHYSNRNGNLYFYEEEYEYDDLLRPFEKTVYIRDTSSTLTETISYQYKNNGTKTSVLISDYSYTVGDDSVTNKIIYDDANRNIVEIRNASDQILYKYTYDHLDRLVREDNSVCGKTYVYTYDANGNILTKKTYSYTTGALGNETDSVTYTYGNRYWKDQLTSFDGYSITYDELGNPLSYYNGSRMTLTWNAEGYLASASKSGTNITFTYSGGLRISKKVGTTVHSYTYDGDLISSEEYGTTKLLYFYDKSGAPVAFRYNGTYYLYEKNSQGDIIGIYNTNGTKVVTYKYDAWGNVLSTTGSLATTVGAINPFRYRGYYYDTETGFYWLRTRYYDPVISRFINPDDVNIISATPTELTDKNLYAYCDNNPVMRADQGGNFWHIVIGAAVGGVIGTISSIVGQVVSGNDINWGEVAVSAGAGALSGAINAACPGMGAVATGLVQGAIGAGTYAATELVNGRTPTIGGTLAAGITSGVLAGGAKAIGNALSSGKLEIGRIKGGRASEGYPGIRLKTNAGPAYSVEFHGSHNGHTPHLQVNKWLYHFKGYEGQPYRFRSWHFEFLKPWKGVF